MKEILPLSSLRFLAAMLVVVEHLQMFRWFDVIGIAWDHQLGAIGVCLFFVLSGYILSYTYLDNDWTGAFRANSRDFFVGRLARIFPLHWLTFLIALPLGLNSHTSRVSVSDFPSLLTLTNGLWPGFETGPQPVKVAWTLSCEALFYLVTPALFLLLARTARKASWSGVITVGFTLLIYGLAISFPELNWFAYLRLPEFLLGIFGFIVSRNLNLTRVANALFAWGAVLLFVAALNLPGLVPHSFMPFTMAPGALLVIVGCAHCSGRLREIFSWRRFVLLGHASYALYLMHDPAMRYLKVFMNRTGFDASPTVTISVVFLLVGAVIAGSILTYRYFESPARWLIRNRLSRKPDLHRALVSPETAGT